MPQYHSESSQKDRLDHIMDEIGCGYFQLMAMFGLGCRIFVRGSVVALTTILEPFFRCKYQLSLLSASFYLTLYLVSMVLFSWPSGLLANKFGKRKTILLLCSMSAVTAILLTLSQSFMMIVIAMTAFGVFDHASYFIYPYLLEILPIAKRKYLPLMEIFYVSGFFGGIVISYVCIRYLAWQMTVVFSIIIPLLVPIMFSCYLPESPRYLLSTKDVNAAINVLVKIATKNNFEMDKKQAMIHFQNALCENEVDSEDEKEGETMVYKSLMKNGKLNGNNKDAVLTQLEIWQRIFTLCVLRYSINLCRSSILYSSGQKYSLDKSPDACNQCFVTFEVSHLMSVSIGLFASLTISYHLVHHVNRRTIFLTLLSLLAIVGLPFFFVSSSWIVTGLFFVLSAIADCLFVVMFVYISEAVPTSMRGITVGIVSGVGVFGDMCSALLATFFLHVNATLSLSIVYSIVIISIVFVYFFAVETKNISLN